MMDTDADVHIRKQKIKYVTLEKSKAPLHHELLGKRFKHLDAVILLMWD